MSSPWNQAAWLIKAGEPLQVKEAPMPIPGAGEIVIKNAAIAINPLDTHMLDIGVFVQQWPSIFGCDVAGEVYEVGAGIDRFKKGDRVIGHTVNLTSGRPQDGAFQLYTVVQVDKAAILPADILFTDGVVVPFALEAAVCALSLKVPGVAMPGVPTPALGLPYPSVEKDVKSIGKVLVVSGGSSSAGSMTVQVAAAAGITVIVTAGKHNFALVKECGATQVFDHASSTVVSDIISVVKATGHTFIGIFDAISSPSTYANDLTILEALGGGHLACTHPPPADVPSNVKGGMIFAVNDVATPVWREWVTPALENRKLMCLPPANVVGKGLEFVQVALEKMKDGVSATKLVVEL